MAATEEDMNEGFAMQDEADIERQAAMAEAAEREREYLASQQRAEQLDEPMEEFGHGAMLGITNTLGIPADAANAILNAVGIQTDAPMGGGESIQDVMEFIGAMPEDSPEHPVGPTGRAGEALGMATVMTPAMLAPFIEMAMDPNFEMRQGNQTRAFHGGPEGSPTRIPRSRAAKAAFLMKQLGQQITRTAVDNPKMFVAAEAAGALGSGYAMGKVEEADGSPAQQMVAGVAAGVGASLTVSGLPRGLVNMWRWGMRNLAPFTEAGGSARAAAQVQARTEDIPAAVAAIDDAPPGVTPARATGERRLMGQEQHMLEEDPGLDLAVRQDLENAVRRSQRELRGLYETPQGKADWEYAVMNRIAPEGTVIPAGSTDEMLDVVYRSFDDLYEVAKGFPIRNRLMTDATTSLDTQIANVSKSRAVMAGGGTRKQVRSWLENQMEGLRSKGRTLQGETDKFYRSDDILTMRSRVRQEIRKQRKSTTSGSNERADLLEIAEQRLTGLLHDQMPEEALLGLKNADDYYRNYKILEDAVYRSGEGGLTPAGLLTSIRGSSSSKGAYARGEGMELRSLAKSGRQIDELMNNPEQVGRLVQNMAEDDILNLKSQFMEEIFRRSIPQNTFGPDGQELISGVRLQGNRNKFMKTARALGFDDDEIGRLDQMITQMRTIEKNPEAAVAKLFEDGPSTIMELGAVLLGAKSGQRLAEGGIGSSMVMASYGANKWRGFLGKFTSDQAERLMREAVQDPEKFKALLLQPGALPAEKNAAFQLLMTAMQQPMYELGEQIPGTVDQATKEMKEKLEDVRREAEALGPLF